MSNRIQVNEMALVTCFKLMKEFAEKERECAELAVQIQRAASDGGWDDKKSADLNDLLTTVTKQSKMIEQSVEEGMVAVKKLIDLVNQYNGC